jgi:hypothetical protein
MQRVVKTRDLGFHSWTEASGASAVQSPGMQRFLPMFFSSGLVKETGPNCDLTVMLQFGPWVRACSN